VIEGNSNTLKGIFSRKWSTETERPPVMEMKLQWLSSPMRTLITQIGHSDCVISKVWWLHGSPLYGTSKWSFFSLSWPGRQKTFTKQTLIIRVSLSKLTNSWQASHYRLQ
jgi:hypothetical protein